MSATHITFRVLPVLLLLSLASPIAAQKQGKDVKIQAAANLPSVIWQDAGDITTLNLFYGAGGKEHAPDPGGVYRFIKEDAAGTSPKFDVEDAQGVQWKAKLGQEPQPETAATRLLWAAGYFVDEDYYVSEIKVTGLPRLRRGQSFVSADGTVHRVRLKRHSKGVRKLGNWDWFRNPFANTRELNGLRIMMAVLNNWDLSTANNAIEQADGQRRYLVSDVGATFGNTGNNFTRSKSVLKDYVASKFIERTTGDSVDFVLHSRPFVLSIVNAPNYRDRTRMEQVAKHIPRADAEWLGRRLARLSEDQLRDAFRAGGYTPDEVEGYAKKVKEIIAALSAL